MKKRFWMQLTILAMVVSIASTGCLGRFAAFNKLLDWNRGVDENEWVNEALFVALLIIPVYEVALLADVVIFNSVEFWTHNNPVDAANDGADRDYRKTASLGTTHIVQRFSDTGGRKTMVTDRYEKGRLVETVVLFREDGAGVFRGVSATREGRVKVFRIEPGTGGPVLTEYASGESPRVAAFTRDELQQKREGMVGIGAPASPVLASAR